MLISITLDFIEIFFLQLFIVQLSDDPFEVKLGDNYDLLKDECNEGIKRKKVLDQKIQETRSRVIIPGGISLHWCKI